MVTFEPRARRSLLHYAEAEPLYKRALAIDEKALGPDHPDLGAALNNLAGLYQDQGRYAEAEPLAKLALAITEKALGRPDTQYQRLADEARAKQGCEDVSERAVAAIGSERGGVQPLAVRGGLANVAQIRAQVPLPETADELCEVARDLGSKNVRLGAAATEAEVKRLSETGELSRYRVIHFATHGALAGQVSGNAEPGLLLKQRRPTTAI